MMELGRGRESGNDSESFIMNITKKVMGEVTEAVIVLVIVEVILIMM